MNTKQFSAIFVLVLAVSVATSRIVRAGSPPTTGAAVHGTVRLNGKVPPAKTISMNADPACAKLHPSPVAAQEVMADAKGDLENVIVCCGRARRSYVRSSQPTRRCGTEGLHVPATRACGPCEPAFGTGQ